MKVALLLLLVPLALAMTCVSSYPKLQSLCEEVAPKVEALWGKVNATVELAYGSHYLTTGRPLSHQYLVQLKEPNPCALAHELTHVIELEKGAYSPKWFAEGLADLSCYLLYPQLYKESGYVQWVERGYGGYSPYFFGVTVLYYEYVAGGDVWGARLLTFKEASEIFARALEEGLTPYGVRPGRPAFVEVELSKGWAFGGSPSGEYWKFNNVEVFYGPGKVSYALPFILPLLTPSWMRKCGSSVRRLKRRTARST